jgi:hypothetical protein
VRLRAWHHSYAAGPLFSASGSRCVALQFQNGQAVAALGAENTPGPTPFRRAARRASALTQLWRRFTYRPV